MILFRLTKKAAISANLFTPEYKLRFNCVLCGTLLNKILEDQKTAKFLSLRLPILQISRGLWFCFV
jgi:hypothetical protein